MAGKLRRPISITLIGALAALALAGCGAGEAEGRTELFIYVSAPLIRDSGLLPQDAIDAAGMALADAGQEAGGIPVGLKVLTGSDPGADASLTAALGAREAARDSKAIGYIGEFAPEATAASVPITNGAGIPQVAPFATTGELLREREGGTDIPTSVQTSGVRTLIALVEEGGPLPTLPAEGRELLRRFETEFGRRAGKSVPFAYESMALLLDALDRARDPLDRGSVVAALLETRDRDSILGTYSIDPSGVARFEP